MNSGGPKNNEIVTDGFVRPSCAPVFLIHLKKAKGGSLAPLYFWGLDHGDTELGVFAYDVIRGADFTCKAVQLREEFLLGQHGDLSEAWQSTAQLRETDQLTYFLDEVDLNWPGRDP
jgi:hypothetical protein